MTTTNVKTRLGAAASLCILGAALLGLSCASAQKLPQEPGFNPRLTPTTYLEEGQIAALAVDTEAAAWREKEPFIPLPASVLNKGLMRITLTRESFTLVDEAGNRYPLASVDEGRSIGPLASIDWRMSSRFFDVIATSYTAWSYERAVFFPNALTDPPYARRSLLRDRVELYRWSWMADILYFPHPKGPVQNHKFELWVTAPELPDPLFVRFRIPVR